MTININNADFITTYLAINADKFPPESLMLIQQKIAALHQEQQLKLSELSLKDPLLALLLSFFFGTFGVDRFYIGNFLLGLLKLITIGGFGVWTIVDWCIMMKTTRKQNLEKLLSFLNKL